MSLGTFTALQDDGTTVEMRPILNIVGATVTDDSTNNRITVAINSPDGDITLAAGKSLLGTTGAGAVSLGSLTGACALPTGNLSWAGANTKTLSLVSTAGAVTIKSTTSGTVLVDSAGALNLGTTDATSVGVSKTGVTTTVNGALTVAENANLNGASTTIGNAVTDELTVTAVVAGGALTFKKEVNATIAPAASTTAATAGANLTVLSANGNGAAAGNARLDTGTGTAGGNVNIGTVNAAQVTIGNATSTTTMQGTSTLFDGDGVTFADACPILIKGSGTGTGEVVKRYGGTATEGLEIVVFDDVISPAAIETNVVNVPANSVIYSVQGNCQAALTGGGTTVTWSLGVAADPDKYGTAGDGGGDSLAQNSKSNWTATPTRLASAEQIVLTGAATGGAADGDTALTVGSVRVRVVYATCNSLDNA